MKSLRLGQSDIFLNYKGKRKRCGRQFKVRCKLLGKIKTTFWLNSGEKEGKVWEECEGAGGPSQGDGFVNMLAYAHFPPHLSLSLSPYWWACGIHLSPAIHHEQNRMSQAPSVDHVILHYFLFPLFLSERRCLWLAPSTWLIKRLAGWLEDGGSTGVTSWLCTWFWKEHNVSGLLWISYTQVFLPLTEQVARCPFTVYK